MSGFGGRTIVVTGAGRGMGAAVTALLARRRARVIATDVEAPSGLGAPGIDARALDVSDEDGWRALAADIEREGRPLHGLVNNAGITHRARLSDIERPDWDRVLAVNTTGPLLGIRHLAPLMTRGSSIVNVGSSAAVTAHYPVAYTTSKWALRGLTSVAAHELGPRGIRVNIVHPGFIDTAMTRSAPDRMRTAHLRLTPMERVGESAEVAEMVAFLLSDATTYVSGAEIPVDGGFTSAGGSKYLADELSDL